MPGKLFVSVVRKILPNHSRRCGVQVNANETNGFVQQREERLLKYVNIINKI